MHKTAVVWLYHWGEISSAPFSDYNKSDRRKFHVSYLKVLCLVSVDGTASIYIFIDSFFIYSSLTIDYKVSRAGPYCINISVPN